MSSIEDEENKGLLTLKPKTKRRNFFLVLSTFVLVLVSLSVVGAVSFRKQVNNAPHLVVGHNGAVAVETKECSDAGLAILMKGGSAVDSAIASALCIGVVNSFATGIGGGGFMLIRTPNASYEFIDFRETAPAASTKDMFVKDPMSAQRGGLAVGVPGEIRGFELAHQRYGKLDWSELFTSAIKVAREGFEVTDLLYSKLVKSKDWIEDEPGFAEVYAPKGEIAQPGDWIKRPTLADTLEKIAKGGPNVFYEGAIAEAMVKTTQANGGILTLEDLRDYRPLIRPVVSSTYHGRKVVTTPAPTSGPVLLSILNIIEGYNFTTPSSLTIHRFVEALKFGFAFRTELADPDFVPIQDRLDEIITKEWAEVVRKNITDNSTHDAMYYRPQFEEKNPQGTMHLSIIDSDNSAVSLTSTVNLMFGAKFMDTTTGIIMNDEMDDFSIPGTPNNFGLYPSAANYVVPGKRPLSSITPVIIEDNNELDLVIGGSGGSQILSATLNAILNTYDFGDNIFEAVKAPRIHHQLLPNEIGVEDGYNETITHDLSKLGHKITNLKDTGTVSAVQAVRRFRNGTLHATSDPRKGGLAAAY